MPVPEISSQPEAGDVAAVDLGSNSFHMLVAREDGGALRVLDRLREPVRLGAGLQADGTLDEAARARALDCLARFGQRLRGLAPQRVRAVGTNTLRQLEDGGAFLAAAEAALGHEIEVISGVEEARLVYGGVMQGLGPMPPRRLVIDIGGGSTELIIGRGSKPHLMESVSLGCVSHSRRFFGDGEITRARMRQARLAARVEMEFLQHRYRRHGWDVAIGASGTVRGVWRVVMAQGWADERITRGALEKAVSLVVNAGNVRKLDLPGLRDDRQPVFAGGLAVLAGVFDTLELDAMLTSASALREGLVFDLVGRLHDDDVRSRTVEALARRYAVDRRQAAAVERTALRCLDQVAAAWKLDARTAGQYLRWAARLHEVGLAVAHAGFHRHGEYLLRYGDLAGFSQTEQQMLAVLVRLQRGRFHSDLIDALPKSRRSMLRRLAMLFRLSVLLHRSRGVIRGMPLRLEVTGGRGLRVSLPQRWLDARPLTEADLLAEAQLLAAANLKLELVK